MLKDRFTWHACIEEITSTPLGERVTVALEGNCISPLPTSMMATRREFTKEIEDCLNDDGISGYQQQLAMYKHMLNATYGLNLKPMNINFNLQSMIKDVIFNDPATIVLWKDGTKTVVKVQDGETFDPMVGLSMCIAKKAMGNQGNYFEVFKKYCEPWYEEQWKNFEVNSEKIYEKFKDIAEALKEGFAKGISE